MALEDGFAMARTGRLHTIKVQRISTTTDAVGSLAETWGTVVVLRATRIENTASETAAFAAPEKRPIVLRTRYCKDLRAADRVQLEGAFYEIAKLTETGPRGMELHLIPQL
jgi:SPP1 family predicted phage head-tail adaptor